MTELKEMDEDFGFIDGFLYNRNKIVVVASSAKLEEKDVQHAFVCYWKDGAWDYWDEGFSVIKVCAYTGTEGLVLVEMGQYGEVTVADATGFRSETLDITQEAPSRLRPLNDIKCIGDFVYLTGMRRQVYRRRLSESRWERCDAGVLVPRKSKEVAGFTSIDGFGDSEVYAVGYGGQLWQFDGSAWYQIASPTNIRLESIRCIRGDAAIAVGDQGIILKGRKDQWDIVRQDLSQDTFTDVEVSNGTVYISTEVGLLYRLDGPELVGVRIPFDRNVTTGGLHSDGENLLSVGERDLLLFDGSEWSEIPHPILPAV